MGLAAPQPSPKSRGCTGTGGEVSAQEKPGADLFFASIVLHLSGVLLKGKILMWEVFAGLFFLA